jgi:hypothetical protein
MKTLHKLKHLMMYPLRSGKTHAAIHGLKGNADAFLMVISHQHALALSKQYNIQLERFLSIDLVFGDKYIPRQPLLIDNTAMVDVLHRIEKEHLEEIAKLRAEIHSLKGKSHGHTQQEI